MTHLQIYFDIINHRKNNPLPSDVYVEHHHIVPKCMCKLLAKCNANIIALTAEEHFMVHYHLWKAFKEELHDKKVSRKLAFAFNRMKRLIAKCDDIQDCAKLYSEVKTDLSEAARAYRHSEETKQKMRDNHGYASNIEEWKKNLRKSRKGKRPALGMHHTQGTKERISKSLKTHWENELYRSKMKNRASWNKGKKGLYHATEETKRRLSEAHKNPSKETRYKNGNAFRGKVWANNGNQQKPFFEDEIPIGWKKGRIKKPRS